MTKSHHIHEENILYVSIKHISFQCLNQDGCTYLTNHAYPCQIDVLQQPYHSKANSVEDISLLEGKLQGENSIGIPFSLFAITVTA